MPNTGRSPAIDALRTLAVLGMMAAHTSRLIAFNARQEWSYLVLMLEPLIPSLFLFLVGISLTYSISKSENPGAWYKRQVKRALVLWLISSLFFALEENIRLPDVFIASGILCTIAYAIVLLGALLLLPKPIGMIGFIFCISVFLFLKIDFADAHPFLLISGNSPLFPLLLFAAAGTLWGLVTKRLPHFAIWIGLPSSIIAIWLIRHYGWENLFTYPLGRSDATRVLTKPLFGGIEKSVPYYNLRPLLALFCLCVHLSCLGVLQILNHLKDSWSRQLFLLGRNALEVYILHLFLLAMLVVSFGLHPLKAVGQGDAVMIGIILICVAWSNWRENHRKWHF